MKKIIVDEFYCKNGKNENIHILTHAHTDHGMIPQKFPNVVYCSPMTAQILISTFPYLASKLKPILIPNKYIIIHECKIFIFDSNHSFGSIGFIYNQELYWGDGRPSEQMIHFLKTKIIKQPLQTIKVDLFFNNIENRKKHDIDYDLPTADQTTQIVAKLIQNTLKPIWIRLPHFGGLHVLPSNYNYTYIHTRNKPIPNQNCLAAFRFLRRSTNAKKIKISLHSPKLEKYFVIYLSTLWWFFENCPQNRNLFEPHFVNENYTRVFLSTHASLEENKMLLKLIKGKKP